MGHGADGEGMNLGAPMRRSDERILTTHTGSLPRPPALTQLYARRARGEAVDNEAIDAGGRAAVAGIVGKQIAAGLDVIDNGEQTRESFVLYLRDRLTGLGGSGSRAMSEDIDRYPEFKRQFQARVANKDVVSVRDRLPKTIGPIAYKDRRLVERECVDFADALVASGGAYAEAFMTAPSPGILAAIVQNDYYDSLENYLAAIAAALKVEYETIVKAGFVLQLDCPELGLERHTSYRDRPLREFVDFVALVVATINRALAGIPRDRVRLHVCWGNYEAPHDSDVELEAILPEILKAEVGALVLPFANPRHAHEFKAFARTPLRDDQLLVAGVIDTLTNFVEHPEVVADRIERVAAVLGDPRRVLAGTDCGFETSAGMGRVADDVVWAKLAALTEGSRIASQRLFAG
jgi:5-methyltetrahydropteroyltriglutamate--homocysteine methyltransferase